MLENPPWYHYITINIYYLGLTAISQSMVSLVLPLLVQRFVGIGQQGAALGRIRLWGLMAALLSQSLMGLLSDHSRSRWGRRRPFILVATFFSVLFLAAIGFSQWVDAGMGYWVLFVAYVLLQIGVNAAQGPLQGLIPDLIPVEKHGLASGIKAVIEVPLALIVVSLTVSRLVTRGDLWDGLIVLMVILVLTMLVTMFVPERPDGDFRARLDWRPFLRLLVMTAVFTGSILLVGEVLDRLGPRFTEIDDVTVLMLVMGAVGFVGMGGAVVVGVFAGVRISVGKNRASYTKPFTWWVVSRLAFLVGATNLASFALFFLEARLQLSAVDAARPVSNLLVVVGVSLMVAALPSGWLADRFGRKRLVALSGLLAATGTLVMVLARTLPQVYVAGVIIGLATGLFYAANWALGTGLVPKAEAGRYLGLSNLAGAGAGAVGAYIGGPMADFFTNNVPDNPGLGYVLIYVVYGLLFLLSVVVLRGVREHVTAEEAT